MTENSSQKTNGRRFEAFTQELKGAEFFKQISKQKINPGYEDGLWSLNNNTIDYEIRCYLWHYFRSAHRKLLMVRPKESLCDTSYGWYSIFKTILENYFLQIISFNYDCVAPKVITELKGLYPPFSINKRLFAIFKSPVEMSYEYYMNFYPPGEIPIVYIHGSWMNEIHFPFPIDRVPEYSLPHEDPIIVKGETFTGDLRSIRPTTGFVANPWLESRIEFVDNYFSTASSQLQTFPWYFPMFPDIVPPGYQGHDRYNPFSKATDTSRKILNEADFVIVCGLSGREPDTEEVHDLLGSIQKDIDVIQVGLSDDRDNPVAVKLKTMENVTWRFFDAITELGMLDEYLKDRSSSTS